MGTYEERFALPPINRAGPVASSAVLSELVWVRGRDGLAPAKLRGGCPNILSLPMTTNELERRRLAADDRHVAAFHVIQCAITTLVPRTDYSQILSLTLNMQPSGATTLGSRRTTLKGFLRATDKEFRRLETEAFDYLSTALVAGRSSPCDGKLDPALAKAELTMTVSATPDVMARLLNVLTLEDQMTVRFVVAEILSELLPTVRRLVAPRFKGEAGMRNLFESAIDVHWPDRDPQLMGPRIMKDLLFGGLGLVSQTTRSAHSLERPGDYQSFVDLRDRSLAHFADILLDIESSNAWRQTFSDAGIPIEELF